jgi:hypothetical protein
MQCVDSHASMPLERMPQNVPAVAGALRVPLPELVEQARRTLDAREEKVGREIERPCLTAHAQRPQLTLGKLRRRVGEKRRKDLEKFGQ